MFDLVNVEKYINRSFVNPYLFSVAFELRYPSSIGILDKIYNIQDLINEKYPNFEEGFPIFGLPEKMSTPGPWRNYSFSNEQSKTKINIFHNSISIYDTDYTQFSIFKKKVVEVFDKFIDCYKISKCLRAGLRYVNRYNLGDDLEKGKSKIIELFEPFININLIPFEKILSNDIEIRKKISDEIQITLRTSFNLKKKAGSYEHILDFDVYSNEKIDIKNYKKILPDLHIVEKSEFLTYVSEKFMNEMKFLD